ncbi:MULTISPECIES: asparagine synthase-related protein [unclassified Nocardiopsis]|uniref:asparagine synthase-related protein n=1 Tax=Nocardiopsis TaxID=2013 RepID=UPI00387B8799
MFPRLHYTGVSRARAAASDLPDPHELHLSAGWSAGQVSAHEHGPRRAVFLGECSASARSIEQVLAQTTDIVTATDRLGTLPGSHAVLVTEGPDLVWAGDLAGTHRLWYRQETNRVRFGSSPIASGLISTPVPDPLGLSAFLLLPDLSDLIGTCPVSGVRPVGPHRVLHVHEGRAALMPRAFPRPTLTVQEGAPLLRDALLDTVDRHCRRSSRVGCDLSGGLDSSTLTVLAARTSRTPVVALTYTDEFARNDDLAHAERISRRTPGLRWTVIEGDHTTLPFTGLEHAPTADVPSLEPLLWTRTRARLAPALRDGTHLVGDGGDVVLGAPLTYLADLARLCHGRRFLTEVRTLARLRQRPLHRVLLAALTTSRTGFGASLSLLADRLGPDRPEPMSPKSQDGVEAGLARSPLDMPLDWAAPTTRAHLAEQVQRLASGLGSEHDGADAHALRMVHRHAEATRDFLSLAHAEGAHVRAPFFDNAVVAACLSVPATERATVLAAKPLLRAAMAHHVPAWLYERHTKGDYSGCEYHGLRRNAGQVRALLSRGLLFETGIVRPDPVLRAVESAVAGHRAPLGAIGRVLAVELWLRARQHPPAVAEQSRPMPSIGVTP